MTYSTVDGKVVKNAKKAKTVKSSIAGYAPDAGLNSPALTDNHYWFQVSEFVQYIAKNPQLPGYMHRGQNSLEMTFSVDIMDQAGDCQMAPVQPNGYCATIRFTVDQMRELAESIGRGGMSVRITGRPDGVRTKTAQGEPFMVIDCVDIWSQGNDSGNMMFMCMGAGMQMIRTDSSSLRKVLLNMADQMDSSVA